MSKILYNNLSGCYFICKHYLCFIDKALNLLNKHFGIGNIVLVAKDETLKEDLELIESTYTGSDRILHYIEGNNEYDILSNNLKHAIDLINNLQITGPLRGVDTLHIVGYINRADQKLLRKDNNYGHLEKIGCYSSIMMYSENKENIFSLFFPTPISTNSRSTNLI